MEWNKSRLYRTGLWSINFYFIESLSRYIWGKYSHNGKISLRNLHYIAIEGTIGVGKTSLANLLSERLKAKLVLEEFEGNPFLSDFYEDPERHAFQTQLWFLIQRYKQQQELRQVDMFQNLVITDYMFVKDRLFASLNLDQKEAVSSSESTP